MQRMELTLLGGLITARYSSHKMRWTFTLKSGSEFQFGEKTGMRVIRLLEALEKELHDDIKGKVGLDDHPAVDPGAKARRGERGDQYGISRRG